MENWQRRVSNTNVQTILFFFKSCLPIQCSLLRFSKCGSFSSDGILTCPSKHTLFLHSRCQSYFLVSSANWAVKLCQACFLCSSLFAPWFNFLQVCFYLKNMVWDRDAAKPTTGKISAFLFHQWPPCHQCPPVASSKGTLGFGFVFSGRQQE